MKIRMFLTLMLVILPVTSFAQPAIRSDSKFPLFTSPAAAQHHCPFDFVVWLDVKTDTYRPNGPPPDAPANSGAYMCKRDADQMDYHVAE